jgi:hypothetical protein
VSEGKERDRVRERVRVRERDRTSRKFSCTNRPSTSKYRETWRVYMRVHSIQDPSHTTHTITHKGKHTYIHIHHHLHTHTDTHTHTHTHTHTYKHLHTYTSTHTHTHKDTITRKETEADKPRGPRVFRIWPLPSWSQNTG